MTKLKTTTLTKTCYYFFFLLLTIQTRACRSGFIIFVLEGGQVGLVTNRVTFMPQILGILQMRMRNIINIYFCYTSTLHNVQEEAQ